jgi:fluoroacetyl-CoA thioesterase
MNPFEDWLGRTATLTFEVTSQDTAIAMLSGDVAVLGTPRLVAWVEAACVANAKPWLSEGLTSVGTRVDVSHQTATPVGANVEVRAKLIAVSDRTARFTVWAGHWTRKIQGKTVLTGTIDRAIVDRDRFLAGVARS